MQGTYTGNLISSSAADKLLEAHDGDLALLYLFMQRTGSFDLEQAAGRLCRTRREMEAAYEKLMRMGLVNEGESCPVSPRPAAPQKVLPPDEPPEYTTEEYISPPTRYVHSTVHDMYTLPYVIAALPSLPALFTFVPPTLFAGCNFVA